MAEPLLPCPFCGGRQAYPSHNSPFWSVYCPGCDTEAVQFWETVDEAIAAWNHRVAPPSTGEPKDREENEDV